MKKIIYILLLLLFSFQASAQDRKKSMDDSISISNIHVYPNPFSHNTNINFNSSEIGNLTFIVQDLLGNTIKSESILLTKGKNILPFYRNKLNAGIYIYTLKTNKRVISKRFVIK